MPIEIREMHIRVSVSAPAGSPSPGGAGAGGPAASAPGAGGDVAHQALVAECVEQVLQVLREGKER